ncbi:NAD(P)H-quinone oxidoreductase subunit 4 [Geitlerinema sp. PCC 9228]|uniref:NAD(P)H-quinone oxidoreductase subunit 4 n=1 Tax=Geitlerinema sp. PCC 9228 TaxID=111611 RepID=UPI0008F9A5D2|nr:NAD(P)H-quinone oxidoreductase subunit 4 [Geitlerinema sp. PCC 9228]
MANEFPWLSAIVLFPLIAAAFIPLLGKSETESVRWYALGTSLVELGLTVGAVWQGYNFQNTGYQLAESYAWVPQVGFHWSLAMDGLSMPLVLLTAIINTLAIWAAWQVNTKPRLFYLLALILYSAQMGVFLAQDLLLFFFMWEIELVPAYLLISIWGGPKRQYAATKFILYTAFASLFILVAGLGLAFSGDTFTLDIAALGGKNYPLLLELLAYAGFLISFGVKLPIFPLHTWLPDAHGEASAPVSMILAGVLLKMGGYALIRFNMELLPNAHLYFAPILVVLGIVNIIYGALTAFAHTNMKRRLASSSISHMGFVVLGIGSLTDVGVNGAMMQMISHGLIAAMLFFLAGVTYDRTHTLAMDEMGGLAKNMPKAFALFTAAAMASLALPGMSGFIGELTVFVGVANSDFFSSSFKTVTILLAAVGLIATPVYLLSMLRQVFYGKEKTSVEILWQDAKPREVAIAMCLLLPIIGIGVYPKLATRTYDAKTVEVAAEVRKVFPVYANQRQPQLFSGGIWAPKLPSDSNMLGVVEVGRNS